MTHEKFSQLIEELDKNGALTLVQKNQKYSSKEEALLNFKNGADISGNTMAQTCWMYLTKHLAALRKMVQEDNFSNREDFLEKCQDSINYIRFLWAIGNIETQGKKPIQEFKPELPDTINVPYIPPTVGAVNTYENGEVSITGTLRADNDSKCCLD